MVTRAWEQRYAELEAMVADACVSMKARRSGSDHFKRSGEYRRFGEDDREAEEGHLRGGGRQTYGSLTRLAKIEFPRFNGENVRGWVFKAEEFFGVDFTPPDLKVKMAAIHFDGFASEWHHNFIKSDVGMSVLYDWKSYVHFLREMFEDEEEDPLAELKKLKETDGIRQYHQKFENIRTRLKLPEDYLMSVYLAGLRLETRRHIKMFQPQTVRHCFFLGKTYEKAHPKPPMTANWNPKSVNSMDYSRDQKEKTVDVTVKTNLQPTKRLSQQEMNDRRSKNLCYLCDEKYTPEHYAVAHKKTQLFCMGVEDEFEDAEEKLGEVEEVVNNTSEPMPRISVNAVSGISDYDTMRAEEPLKPVADKVHVQPIELVVRDQAQEARSDVVSLPGVSVTRVGAIQSQPCIFGQANHVWKPGELEQVMVTDDVVSLEKHVKLYDCVALPLITPSSSVLQVFSHANRSVWEPGEFRCVQVQENRVQHERNKAEGVEFSVQRIDVASEMENQTVTAVVVYDKRSDRVWEPGGLPIKLKMWDWTEKHPENFQPFHQNQVFDELEVVESKSSTNPMLGSMLKRHHKRQQVRKLRLSPKPWLFKFKQKLIRLKIRDKEFRIGYLSQFSSKVGIDKEHSSSSLRANQIWDPGGKISLHLKLPVNSQGSKSTLQRKTEVCPEVCFYVNLEVKVFQKREICYRKTDMGLSWFMGLPKRRWAASQVTHEDRRIKEEQYAFRFPIDQFVKL